ncbi:uncharacterized protein LOC123880605 [Maniola jurtina]|uniref:uncharacterized protein LOC123880605 n=1 Tax=Maniola jurtina TaxID=191418 RepID=UPI001E68D015|nr:uncharacterized protein LOC123880605 [Maniola jurtina]XP_045784759.1 uncharacterized protein LOC123880605 [Maniola jurtina]
MERFKKLKKEKPGRSSSKDKQPLFITDVKSIKENIKIKEILRTVKMNSSMRLKAPPGSKVMNNKDFNDDDCFEESSTNQSSSEIWSATNPDVVVSSAEQKENEIDSDCDSRESTQKSDNEKDINTVVENKQRTCNEIMEPVSIEQSSDSPKENCDISQKEPIKANTDNILPNGKPNDNSRDRKLSLDHTMLSRLEGLSQSELDLHSIGKSPLERKSSFFRKTMDSFVRNTTEIFKKQNKSLQRRVSMSVSLQSLNDKSLTSNDYREIPIQQVNDASDSRTDLLTPTQIARSNSSLSSMAQRQSSEQSLADSYAGSQPTLHPSGSTMENLHSSSVHSLNEDYVKEAMLNSRAISMSSGLDSPFGNARKKSSLSNRVTWVASEGLTNYLRRVIQDEKIKELQSCQSYQDFSSIPENEQYNRKLNTKGRRLSYQRAVSGEDPVIPTKYPDSTIRRKHHIPEIHETHVELANLLAGFSRHGVPQLRGFQVARVPEEAFVYMLWATNLKNINEYFDFSSLPPQEQERQAAIRELIHTEAEHIKHLMAMIEVFIAAAHALQNKQKMLNIDTEKLFANIPDVLNASLYFWTMVMMPMIKDGVLNDRPFNTELMANGFTSFTDVMFPYEKYVVGQSKLLEYYHSKRNDPEFSLYLSWCYNQKESRRLQLNDFFVKPMQRLTKYTLLLRRLIDNTDESPERSALQFMEDTAKAYVIDVNRSVRQREEYEKLNKLQLTLEAYESDLKDDELERQFKLISSINLRTPMLHCRPYHSRCLIHQANLRFRDGAKETDARVILLTDMLLVCKRLTKSTRHCKLIRPKYMIDKLVQIPKFVGRNSNDLSGIGYIAMDDLGSASTSFILTESPKDPDPQKTLRTWENKVKEAKLTYEMTIWSAQNPDREMTDAELQDMVDRLQIRARSSADEAVIEHEARERVAAMVHESKAAPNFDPTKFKSEVIVGVSARQPGSRQGSHIFHRTAPAPVPKSLQMSLLKPTNNRAHSEEQPGPSTSRHHRRTTSLEPLMIPPLPSYETTPSITVHLSDGDDAETKSTQHPTTLQESESAFSRSMDGSQQQNLLRVQSQNNVATLIYSLPDLTVEPCTPKSNSSPTQSSASQMLYQSHQELLQHNRLEASQAQQYLSPDHRGSSYPPPSPTRGSLKRSLAFSYSVKATPTLTKMDHVGSQSPIQMEDAPSTSQQERTDRGSSPKPGPSSEKSDKKSSATSSFFGSGGWHYKRDG